MRILVVEDEHRIAQNLKQGLEQESYAVDVCYDGEEGYSTARTGEYDLIVMDVMMPELDGYEVTKKLREEKIHTPILLLTAKDQAQDIVTGLDTGADDYLSKPFSFEILMARIRALLRRPQETAGALLQSGNLTLNPNTKEVKRDGKQIMLSSKEFALLEYMLRNKDRVLSKNNLISHVWDFDADILPNTVEVLINYLRSKVDKPFKGPAIIQTVRGFGYRISSES